jgi:hypothetical protein
MLLMLLMLPMPPPPPVRDTLMLGQGQVKQGAAPPLLGLKCSACSVQVREPATMEAPSMRWQEKDMARCWARAAAARELLYSYWLLCGGGGGGGGGGKNLDVGLNF